MAVSITLTFDDDWALRLRPVVFDRAQKFQRHPVIRALLQSAGVATVDELSTKQVAKLVILFDLLLHTMNYEGDAAERVARNAAVEDVKESFPLAADLTYRLSGEIVAGVTVNGVLDNA
jgi:hypothetical protein